MKRKLSFNTLSDLIVRSLEFSEKFTTLHKVIANSLHINRVVRNIGLKILLVAITLLSFTSLAQKVNQVKTVVLDAGHGGFQPGTVNKTTKEKDITLKVTLKVGAYIEKNFPDVKVLYTRKKDVAVGLDERAHLANVNKADLFISIHVNASPSPSAYGTETWVMGLDKNEKNMSVSKRENAVILLEENYKERYEGFDPTSPESQILFELTQSAFKENSLKAAAKVEQQFKNRLGRKSLGVKQGPFWVLWATSMPSILIELGFLSNAKEEQYLLNESNQDLMASAIYRAFKEYKEELESVN